MSTSHQLSIQNVALATGLTPGVIRVWEDRYGWPSPKRHSNGHRFFTPREVEKLKQIALLVKAGTPIGDLIVNGIPQFPVDHRMPALPGLKIVSARTLPGAKGPVMNALRDDLCQALQERHLGRALETIQRARLDLRPFDELRVVLIPALVGLAELHQQHYVLPDEATLIAAIRERCTQLLRRFPTQGSRVTLQATTTADDGLAQAVAGLLAARGIPTRVVTETADVQLIVTLHPPTGLRDTHGVTLTALPCNGCIPVIKLLGDDLSSDLLMQLAAPAMAVH